MSSDDDLFRRVNSLLHYDPVTGIFVWKSRTSHRVRVGDTAGTHHSKGYVIIGVDGHRMFAHRLAYLLMMGELPFDQIDHANGIKDDNRWENLRACDGCQNHSNMRKSKANSTGVKGVYIHSQTGRYTSQITVQGNRFHLGCFQTLEEAKAVREQAELTLCGEFANFN